MQAAIGILFVWNNFNPIVAISMFLMIASYYVIMRMQKSYVWMLTVVWLAILNMLKQSVWEETLSSLLNEKEICDAMIALSWLLLRVTSFAIDYCNDRDKFRKSGEYLQHRYSTAQYFSYSFYLPIYLHGPPIIYERYASMYAKNRLLDLDESFHRLKELLISMVHIGCIYLVNEFCMHFIYANVIIYNADVSKIYSLHTRILY